MSVPMDKDMKALMDAAEMENPMFEMTPIESNTRIREGHNTSASVIQSVAANIVVSGNEI